MMTLGHSDAAQLDRLADQVAAERTDAAAALRWVAALLREDPEGSRSWLTKLLGEVTLDELLGVVAIRLDLLAAESGDPRIAQAAARANEAALLYDSAHGER